MDIWGILLMIAVGIVCFCFGNLQGMAWSDRNNAPADKARMDYIKTLERHNKALTDLLQEGEQNAGQND